MVVGSSSFTYCFELNEFDLAWYSLLLYILFYFGLSNSNHKAHYRSKPISQSPTIFFAGRRRRPLTDGYGAVCMHTTKFHSHLRLTFLWLLLHMIRVPPYIFGNDVLRYFRSTFRDEVFGTGNVPMFSYPATKSGHVWNECNSRLGYDKLSFWGPNTGTHHTRVHGDGTIGSKAT